LHHRHQIIARASTGLAVTLDDGHSILLVWQIHRRKINTEGSHSWCRFFLYFDYVLLWLNICPDPVKVGGEAEHAHEGSGAPFPQARPQNFATSMLQLAIEQEQPIH